MRNGESFCGDFAHGRRYRFNSTSFFSSSSPTSAGLALPPVCFMTWPRRKPLTASGFFLPFFRSSMAWGLAAIAASTAAAIASRSGDHLVAAAGR